MSGCGCKNKGNQPQSQQATTQLSKQQQSEGIKEAIKKTVEKYYNVNKTSN